MHFLTFIPDCSPNQIEERAKAAGLLDLLGGHNAVVCNSGPNGLAGIMIAHMQVIGSRHDYSPNEQEWVPSVQKVDGKPLYYVGFWTKEPPKENELRRNYTQPGPLVHLGDDQDPDRKTQSWKLPTPKTVYHEAIYNDDGTMRWEVIRRFAWVCDEAEQLATLYDDDGKLTMRWRVFCTEPSVQIDWILKLLRINYRMLPEVASYLHFWVGEDKLYRIFCASFGVQLKE